MLIDKTNIRKLIQQYEDTIEWLSDNSMAPLSEYMNVANEMAILSVRISNYYKKNKL